VVVEEVLMLMSEHPVDLVVVVVIAMVLVLVALELQIKVMLEEMVLYLVTMHLLEVVEVQEVQDKTVNLPEELQMQVVMVV